eukprot:CAMPEP_0185791866 /NCGR_PEP_ID=MMETSP1174-20130828/158617_1 /TAXON_ID=35687 /ORGANISM="Dictyocha speculum, Strain CCMP1381" /LENGTH=178 /DNA_ID=CAMNT_0028486869 /DNA_START=52 /DNA_END=588 /DNA_ORIENTATION=+
MSAAIASTQPTQNSDLKEPLGYKTPEDVRTLEALQRRLKDDPSSSEAIVNKNLELEEDNAQKDVEPQQETVNDSSARVQVDEAGEETSESSLDSDPVEAKAADSTCPQTSESSPDSDLVKAKAADEKTVDEPNGQKNKDETVDTKKRKESEKGNSTEETSNETIAHKRTKVDDADVAV